ncbi:DUF481 domain-containing protein [Pelagicoccus sp. SDUM812003]|uniref:DUF481 domain-containing protein n=1 Tax=Pelagicoccus sp. SDUM812003 TaxID=3041267 RepID=UPI002811AE20|nr:DUF481 domain-containing protein [Pelagicoccus sp. SDUM812003]
MAAELVTVYLDNGDTLSGELLQANEESVSLEVDYLGEVSLPANRLVNLEDLLMASDSETAAVAASDAGVSPATVEGDGIDVTDESLSLGDTGLWSWTRFYWQDFLERWENRLQIGLNSASGRKNQSNFNYRLDMLLDRESDQLRFNAEYYYGKANDSVIKNNFASKLRWRKDIGPGVFYESQSIYSADAIKLIDSNLEQKLGLGTRFIDRDDSTLSAGFGASGRWREFENSEEEVIYLVDIFQDWDYRLSERIRFTQDLRFAMPLEEEDNYEFGFSAAVTSAVTNSINLSLRYEMGYDNSLDEELKEDRRFVSSLGYAF